MIDRIAVVVPAANEARAIGACLHALNVAARRVDFPVRVVVVLDACTDDTAQVVARVAPAAELVHVDARNVGIARHAGAAHVLAGEDDPAGLLLASTDADSSVPPRWLAQLRFLAATADVVVGTVTPDLGLAPQVASAWLARHDLADGHPHVHAANLAIRADAYLRLGGWRPLPSGEDEDLISRASATGLRITRSGSIPVLTSTRSIGRAPQGFSSYLRALGHC